MAMHCTSAAAAPVLLVCAFAALAARASDLVHLDDSVDFVAEKGVSFDHLESELLSSVGNVADEASVQAAVDGNLAGALHVAATGVHRLVDPTAAVDDSAKLAAQLELGDMEQMGAVDSAKESAAKAALVAAEETKELAAKALVIAQAAAREQPTVGCPPGTCNIGGKLSDDLEGNPINFMKCLKGSEIPEITCPANSMKVDSAYPTMSSSCVNCNRGGVCRIKEGQCGEDDSGKFCGGCKWAPAGSVSCADCPKLTEPMDALATVQTSHMRFRQLDGGTDLPCKSACNECRSNMTKNVTMYDVCVSVPRNNFLADDDDNKVAFEEPTADDEWCQTQTATPPTEGFTAADPATSAPCPWFESAPFFNAPVVDCPCQTQKTHVCNEDLGGVEETRCALGDKPDVTCGYNQATTNTDGMTVCTYCNSNATCTIKQGGCTESGCTGCKYATDTGGCDDCPALIDGVGPNKDARASNGGEHGDCRVECSECFEDGQCINIHRRNFNEPFKKYALGGPNGACVVTNCN